MAARRSHHGSNDQLATDADQAERDLAGDAQWKLIQKNTFTRWTNEHLKTVNKYVNDLETDLSDGLRVLALVEVLSGHRFTRWNKHPKHRTMKLENVTLALKFLEEHEGIRIVNIDSTDIVDGKLKLILGLIWMLILHYSISMPVWEDGEGSGQPIKEQTPKQRLLGWVQNKAPNKTINNFTTDWNDGKAIGALVDGVAPGLCPDWEGWNPKDCVPNATEAMDAAEKWLDVKKLITPEEMCNPNVDERSMMTYLSQFNNVKLKPNAPLRPKTNPSRVRAYGPGLQPAGNSVGAPARFTVETFSAGRGDLEIIVLNPEGKQEQHEAVFNKDRNLTYSCMYTPTMEGQYKITIKFAGQEIPKSPFLAGVKGMAGDPSKVTAKGPGLEKTGVVVGKKTHFEVHTKSIGLVDVVILDPQGNKDTCRPVITKKSDDLWLVEYTPTLDGIHSINVFFAGKSIPNSPFGVGIAPAVDAKRCYVTGRGIQANGVRVGDVADFKVHTLGAGDGELKVQVLLGGKEEPVKVKKIDATTYACSYDPKKAGEYTVNVTYGGDHVFRSPFFVEVRPAKPTKIRAYGPGLEGGSVGLPACFVVETNGETGVLGFSIEGPSQAKIDCHDNGDGSANITYYPTEVGEYAVHILCDEEDIHGSPYMADIRPADPSFDPSKVTCSGLEANKTVPVNQPVEFIIDTSKAGHAPLNIKVLEAGTNEPVEVSVKDLGDGRHACRFVPTNPVKHVVVATYGGVMIPHFPVRVGVEGVTDPGKVRVFGPCIGKPVPACEPTSFSVDCSKAGPGDVGVSLNDGKGKSVPLETLPTSNSVFNVDFIPQTVGTYTAQVFFADTLIPGNPFLIKVEPGKDGAGLPKADASMVRVHGDGVKPSGVRASMPTEFIVDTSDAGIADVSVIIKDPEGHVVHPEIVDKGNGLYAVKYTPESVGNYAIPVTFGGQPVPNSPFHVKAAPTGDAGKVKFIDGVRTIIPVGEQCVINIDPSEAGPGHVTCRISSNADSDVDVAIVDNGDGTVSVMYTPRKPGAYTLEIKFGGNTIPHGKFTQNAVSAADYNKLSPEEKQKLAFPVDAAPETIVPKYADQYGSRAPGADDDDDTEAGRPGKGKLNPVAFCLPVGPVFNFVSAEVTTPAGHKEHPKLIDNKNGTVAIQYKPKETGLHKMGVAYNEQPIEGSPFDFYVDDPNADHVTAHGPGLSHGVAGNQCDFTVVTRNAAGGELGLAIEGPSKAEMNCKDNGDGSCAVSYFPTVPGPYKIVVKYAEKDIHGSPFTAKILSSAADQQKSQLAVGASSDIPLKVTETDISALKSTIHYPSGKEEPCLLKRLDNGQLGISFTPREAGEHLVNILKHGRHIANSPFKIHVSDKEIGNASRVKVHGKGLSEGKTNEINNFFVDTKDAGYGGLSLSIEGPSKADIECSEEPDGTCKVSYKPTEPGNYVVNIKFADEHVTGSPFLVKIEGEPSGRLTERILRQREAADVTQVGSDCELSLKIPGTALSDMEATVMSPSGQVERCEIKDIGDKQYSIKFVPKELGVHTVSVKHKGLHIPGSPFQFTVGPIKEGGAHKVRAIGPGLQRAEVNIPSHFNVFTREAGAGGLSVAIEGPSKAEIDFIDRKDGSCEIAYTCSTPGDYLLYIKFNDQNIPDSPFKVHVTPAGGDGREPTLRELQDQGCQINKPTGFTVDLGSNKGKLDARVVSPSGAEDEANIQQLDAEHVAIRFVPRENGVHQIYIRQNGIPIPGSPFRVVVGKQDADPAMVHAHGDGLHKGHTGVMSKFTVNTQNAGSGALAVNVDGPSKVHLDCREVEEGYEFMYTPVAPGDYLVSIKYGGNTHIPGSPFKATVTGAGRGAAWNEHSQVVVETVTKSSTTKMYGALYAVSDSDVSKITSKGSGLERAALNKEATFAVDASKAGHSMLLVGVMGPQVPCEEVTIKHLGRNQFTVVYRPAEKGKHVLIVKWGDKHIPGSPFHLNVE